MQSILNILILVGAIQGLITCFLLRQIRSNVLANKLLSWLILFISLACLNIYFLEAVEFTSTIWIVLGSILPLVIIMPIGPLVYFYVKSILYPEFQLSKKNKAHFYTVIIDLLPYLIYLIFILGSLFGLSNTDKSKHLVNFVDNYNKFADIPRWISLGIYLMISRKLLINYKGKDKDFFIWANRFTIGFTVFALIWLLHLIPYIIPNLSDDLLSYVGWYPVYMPLMVLIYWLGINGYIISFKHRRKSRKELQLPVKLVEDTSTALEKAMIVDRLFLNPTLKLDDMVNHLNIPQKVISSVLNQHIGKSFNEFVNTYRVEEFKLRLLNEDSKDLTITGIAFECGFNSQATFQRTFKLLTNLSPKEYQKIHLK
ncbi:AraC family transcriptional regulator [Winogradskyella sp.]|uniref:helix-turn-helix domain-containing protein n=1 Tax=Winogradskyella sp. TaxID=1883156 RepID=UPI00260D246B|nr:helix-turn-helix domain-containing protein [Winogradskyella sp.]